MSDPDGPPFTSDPTDSELGRALIASAAEHRAKVSADRDALAALIAVTYETDDQGSTGHFPAELPDVALADAIIAAGWRPPSTTNQALRDITLLDQAEWPDGHPCRDCGKLAKDHKPQMSDCMGWR